MIEDYIPMHSFDTFSPFQQYYSDQTMGYSNVLKFNSGKYPDLSQYLNSINNDVSKLLDNNIFHLIQSQHPQIIGFLCDHIEDLILLSFDQTIEHEHQSRLSYTILLSGIHPIHDALANNNYSVLKKMSNIALQKDDNYFALRRLIQLIQATIQLSYYWDKNFPLSLAFICLFIPYIYEEFILDFFELICSDFDYFIPVQNWLLKQANFPMIVIYELSKVKTNILNASEYENEPENAMMAKQREKESQKAINLLRLISTCLKSKILSKDFYSYRLVEILNDDWTYLKTSDPLFDELWTIISKIYSKETASFMQGLFQKAIELMTEPYVIIKRFRVGVIDLISKMIMIDETLRPYIIASHIEETVLRLLIQFPGHTFLQNSLLSLCFNAFEIPQMRLFFAKALISPLINESKKEPEGRFFIGFTCEIIQKALYIGQNDKKFLNIIKQMEGFNNFLNDVMRKRNKLIKNGYGGRLPYFKARSIAYEY
ncbi:hypothetical protein M9Y10_005507 [Tritrichomonas musculus]|uniref:Uncharacterized protein n=1 Tax=Tritrichomonas musculus TaxID=1915356 RepID=A0ABR2JCU8_9EUKA